MGKRTRIVLYALSLVTMLAMVTLIIFSRGRQQEKPTEDAMAQTDVVSTEEQIQTPEDHTDTTEGQKNLNNGTGQEETNETETRATEETESEPGQADDTTGDGSTTLIFAGDVLFANAFKSNYDAGGIEKVIEPQLRQGKDILIVGHGAMNASIVCQIKDIPVKDFWSVKMKNAELVRLL